MKDDTNSSIRDIIIKEAAQVLAIEAQKIPANDVIGIFYDPFVYPDPGNRPEFPGYYNEADRAHYEKQMEEWRKEREAAATVAREEAKQLLEQQVIDFADWLKAQGVI
ncbi:MAG: hypothetical protein M5R36_15780 [Deltaproteobacteria bacterium]|nr:hypothetical protein [Deltaproteobacteria bacterium]